MTAPRLGAAPGRAHTRLATTADGVYEAVVQGVHGTKVDVKLIGLNDEHTYEARLLEGIHTKDLRTRKITPANAGSHPGHYDSGLVLGDHNHGDHDHRLGIDLTPGDHVAVTFLGGQPGVLVMLGRFA